MLHINNLIGFGVAPVAVGGNIQFVGKSSRANAGAISLTALTGGIDTACAEGDLVILGFVSCGSGDINLQITTPTGYTEATELFSTDTYPTNLAVYYKLQSATPDTSITIPDTALYSEASIAYVLRGVDQTTPLDVALTSVTGGNSGIIDPSAITPITNNSLIVVIGGSSFGGATATPPTGYTNSYSQQNGTSAMCVIASKLLATAGVENPGAWSGLSSDASTAWASVTLAIRPA